MRVNHHFKRLKNEQVLLHSQEKCLEYKIVLSKTRKKIILLESQGFFLDFIDFIYRRGK